MSWLDPIRNLFAPRPVKVARALMENKAFRADFVKAAEEMNMFMGTRVPVPAGTAAELTKGGSPFRLMTKGGEEGPIIWGSTIATSDAQGLLAGIFPAGQPPKRGTKELMYAFSVMPRLRSAVRKIAKAVAGVPMEFYGVRASGGTKYRLAREYRDAPDPFTRRKIKAALQRAGELKPLPDDHPMREFVTAGNPQLPGRFSVYIAEVIQLLKGDGYAVKVRNSLGTPVRWYPIPPYWVYQTPSVGRPYFRVQYGTWYGDLQEQDVMWWRDPDPLIPYGRGVGMGEALSDDLDNEEFAKRYQGNWFYNSATPSGIISVKGAGQAMLDELEARWRDRHQGVNRSHRLYFTGSDIDFKSLSVPMKDQEILQLRTFEKDTIRQCYNIPPELEGDLTHSNRSTIDSSEYIFLKMAVLPEVEDWRSRWQEQAPEFDERIVVDYEPFIPADKDFILKVMTVRKSAYSEDEVRELTGHDPLPNGDGKERPALNPNLTMASGQLLNAEEGDVAPDLGTHPGEPKPKPEEPNEPAPEPDPNATPHDGTADQKALPARRRTVPIKRTA